MTPTEILYVIINVILIIISFFLIIYLNKLRTKKEPIKEEQIDLSNIVDITPQEFKPEWFELKPHDAVPAINQAVSPNSNAVPMIDTQAVSEDWNERTDLKLEDNLTDFENEVIDVPEKEIDVMKTPVPDNYQDYEIKREIIPVPAEKVGNRDEAIPENPLDDEIKKQLIAFTTEIENKRKLVAPESPPEAEIKKEENKAAAVKSRKKKDPGMKTAETVADDVIKQMTEVAAGKKTTRKKKSIGKKTKNIKRATKEKKVKVPEKELGSSGEMHGTEIEDTKEILKVVKKIKKDFGRASFKFGKDLLLDLIKNDFSYSNISKAASIEGNERIYEELYEKIGGNIKPIEYYENNFRELKDDGILDREEFARGFASEAKKVIDALKEVK